MSYKMKCRLYLWLTVDMGQGEEVERAEGPSLSHQNSLLHMGFYVFSFHKLSPIATSMEKLISKYKRKEKRKTLKN